MNQQLATFIAALALLTESWLSGGWPRYSLLMLVSVLVVSMAGNKRKEKRVESRQQQEDSVEVVSPSGWTAKAQGLTLAAILLGAALGTALYAHHIQVDQKLEQLHGDTVQTLSRNQANTEAALKGLKESIDANTFVLSLPQKDREGLNITMPDSLRSHLGRRREENERSR